MYKKYCIPFLLAACIASCTNDLESEIETLQAQNDVIRADIESIVGSGNNTDTTVLNQLLFTPLIVEHTYSYDGETTLTDYRKFGFSSPSYQHMEQQLGTSDVYGIYVYMWKDTDEDESARVSFLYDTKTKQVTELDYRLSYLNAYDDTVSMSDNSEGATEDSETVVLEVLDVDTETGEAAFNLHITYTGDSNFSEYGQPGEVTFSFNGSLATYYNQPQDNL